MIYVNNIGHKYILGHGSTKIAFNIYGETISNLTIYIPNKFWKLNGVIQNKNFCRPSTQQLDKTAQD